MLPFANQTYRLNASAPRRFESKPVGVTVHFTAGNENWKPSADFLISKGLGYHLLIDKYGYIVQLADFEHRVAHAGSADWLGRSPNYHHISVSLCNWGQLKYNGKDWISWAGKEISEEDRISGPDAFGKERMWHKASFEQITSFWRVLKYLVDAGIDPKEICGHDECAKPTGRKNDPGFTLGMSMASVREELKRYRGM